MAVPTGAAPAVSTLTGWRVCCSSSGPSLSRKIWLSRRDSHPIRRLRRATCFCYTTGKWRDGERGRWWLASATLRSLAGFSGALICLSYPAIWSWRRGSHPQPLDYRSSALLIELLQGWKLAHPLGFAPRPRGLTIRWATVTPRVSVGGQRSGESDWPGKLVGAGGNAPLVGFRNDLTTTGLQSALRIGALFGEIWWRAPVTLRASGGMSPRSSLLGSRSEWEIGRGGRSRACFLMLPRHPSPLLRPHRVDEFGGPAG